MGPDDLLRVVAGPEGSLRVGRTLPGRGAWIHRGSPTCFEQAQRRNAFSRALRTPVSPEALTAIRPLVIG